MYSTTQLLIKEKPILKQGANDKFKSALYLEKGKNRQGEGGLRTQGYFKKSYEDKPLISVITVVFNGEADLEETIFSVINQTYDNVEYILIDGGSTDGTLDRIKKYEDKIDYWVSEEDDGISDAFNKGIMLVRGKRILFLNAGDCFHDLDSIERVYPLFIQHQNIDLIYGKIQLVNENREKIKSYGKPFDLTVFKRHMTLPHQGMFHSREFFKTNGLYDITIKTCMDYELIMKNIDTTSFYFFDDIVSDMLSDGISQTNILTLYKEHLKIQLAYSINSKLKSYFYYLLNVTSYRLKKLVKGILWV